MITSRPLLLPSNVQKEREVLAAGRKRDGGERPEARRAKFLSDHKIS